MTTASDAGQFELVFEGPKDESSETLRKLKGVFIGNFEFSIEDTQKVLEEYPSTVMVADTEEELAPLFYTLRDAGAKVLLVRPQGQIDLLGEDHPEFGDDDDGSFDIDLDDLLGDEPRKADHVEKKEASVYELEEVELSDPVIASMQVAGDSVAGDTDLSEGKDRSVDDVAVEPASASERSGEISLLLESLPLDSMSETLIEREQEKEEPVPTQVLDLQEESNDTTTDDFDLSIDMSDDGGSSKLVDELIHAPSVEESNERFSVKEVESVPTNSEDDDYFNAELSLDPLEDSTTPESAPQAAVEFAQVETAPVSEETAPQPSKTLEAPDSSLSLSFDDEEEQSQEVVNSAPVSPVQERPVADTPAADSGLSLDFNEEPEQVQVAAPEVKQPVVDTPAPVNSSLTFDDTEEAHAEPTKPESPPAPKQTQKASGLAVEEESSEAEEASEPDTSTEPEEEGDHEDDELAPLAHLVSKAPTGDEENVLDLDVEEVFSEEAMAAAAQWQSKKKGGVPYDVIGACLVGVVLLVVYNMYFAVPEGPESPLLQPDVVNAALAGRTLPVEGQPDPGSSKVEKKAPESVEVGPLVNTSGQKELEYCSIDWTIGVRDRSPTVASFVITTPQPVEATPEMIVRGDAADPWITRVEVPHLEISPEKPGKFRGSADAKVYIEYRDQRTRLIGTARLFVDAVTETEYDLELSLTAGDISTPDFVGVVTRKPEESESRKIGVSLMTTFPASVEIEVPEVQKDAQKTDDADKNDSGDKQE